MRLFRKGSYANITATAALVVALGGTSYAAGMITSAQIKNGTIKSIDVKNGTLTNKDLAPKTRSAAFASFHDAAVSIQSQVSGQDKTVLDLDLPAGSYVIHATTWLNNGDTNVLSRCTLSAGADFDAKREWLTQADAADGDYAETVALQVTHTFTSPGTAKLTCYSFGVVASANDTKITAIRVANLTNSAG